MMNCNHRTLFRPLAATVAIFALCLFACDSDPEPVPQEEPVVVDEPAGDEAPEESELVKQAREIAPLAQLLEDEPDQLDGWLEEREMTEDELEELLFDISRDEEASRVYSEAR